MIKKGVVLYLCPFRKIQLVNFDFYKFCRMNNEKYCLCLKNSLHGLIESKVYILRYYYGVIKMDEEICKLN